VRTGVLRVLDGCGNAKTHGNDGGGGGIGGLRKIFELGQFEIGDEMQAESYT
jgi:hypothetical protein